MGADQPRDHLSRWERFGLWLLLAFVVLLGVVTEVRSAFLQRRMGDLQIYLWTAWAVRAGEDIYDITDHNGWHYLYPPLFAILLTPLADRPPNAGPCATLPYPVLVAVWYLLSVLVLWFGVHALASALEENSGSKPARGGRRWWALRALPMLACLVPIGHTLVRGQVNLLLLGLICGIAAATIHGRRWRAGFWLAGAICLKLIPAFLLLFPLWRRDLRCLAGCAVGLFAGLIVIPVSVFGPERTWQYYHEWNQKVLQPGLANGEDKSRAKELIEMDATHSQSFLAVLHKTMYLNSSERPTEASPAVRMLHWSLGGIMTLLTLWAAGWRRDTSGINALLFLGCLVLMMILTSPVCHTHYFCLTVPLVMGLLAAHWEPNPGLHLEGRWQLLLGAQVVAGAVIVLPGMELVRDLGLTMYASLLLWGAAVFMLWSRARHATVETATPAEVSGLAA